MTDYRNRREAGEFAPPKPAAPVAPKAAQPKPKRKITKRKP